MKSQAWLRPSVLRVFVVAKLVTRTSFLLFFFLYAGRHKFSSFSFKREDSSFVNREILYVMENWSSPTQTSGPWISISSRLYHWLSLAGFRAKKTIGRKQKKWAGTLSVEGQCHRRIASARPFSSMRHSLSASLRSRFFRQSVSVTPPSSLRSVLKWPP